jgi:predicted amidophosphoribosyltransferase
MSLSVACQAQYLTVQVDQMRSEDHDATFLVKAVKGLPLSSRQYVWTDVAGVRTKISDANKEAALDWFGAWAAGKIAQTFGAKRVVLLPIPSSRTVRASSPNFRTAQMASKVAERCTTAICHPFLRFKKEQPTTREGASRNPKDIYPELVLTSALPAGDIILIDDVFTTGGHLIASSWKVGDVGRVVAHGLCCGRTTHARLDNPFEVPSESLATKRN